MAHLYRHGETTAGHLAEGLGLGVAGTTTVVDHLDRAGYARRTTHPDDRRIRLISLTPGGAHAAEWVIERSSEVVRPALEGCSADELTRLTELLQAMAAQMVSETVGRRAPVGPLPDETHHAARAHDAP